MKISPIVSAYNNAYNSAKVKSFNGLWGLTSTNSDIEPTLGINMVYETYYYYPFSDESDEEIQMVLLNNNKAYLDNNGNPPKYVVKECKVCSTLPFKKINYDIYRQACEGAKYTTNNRKVHLSIRDKYINNVLDQQISARNAIFDGKEKAKIDLMV